jgi:hypothetical protein
MTSFGFWIPKNRSVELRDWRSVHERISSWTVCGRRQNDLATVEDIRRHA